MTIKKNQYLPETVSHPGFTLAEKLEELNMGNKEFSIRVNKPEKTITAVTKGQSSITADMAVKFEDVLKIPASFWLDRQSRFDIYKARIKRQAEIENAIDWAKEFPYNQMLSLSWVKPAKSNEEKVLALFDFFGVSNHNAWNSYYYNQELKVSFGISLAQTNDSKAISAWLRAGEMKAKALDLPIFDSVLLKTSITEMKDLLASQEKDFHKELQKVCFKAGLALVMIPCLPKLQISGTTRWLGDTPVIQLSTEYKTNDEFWFTFFHQVGHILLHGKKYISIENKTFVNQDLEKEKESDKFANEQTSSLFELI